MNCKFTAPVTRRDVLDALAFDAKVSSSIAGTLTAARENARRAREVISTEVWEALNHDSQPATAMDHLRAAPRVLRVGARTRCRGVGPEFGHYVAETTRGTSWSLAAPSSART